MCFVMVLPMLLLFFLFRFVYYYTFRHCEARVSSRETPVFLNDYQSLHRSIPSGAPDNLMVCHGTPGGVRCGSTE